MKKNDLNQKLDEIADNILNFEPENDEQDTADYMYAIYQSYNEAGFNSVQAFELTKIVLDNMLKLAAIYDE